MNQSDVKYAMEMAFDSIPGNWHKALKQVKYYKRGNFIKLNMSSYMGPGKVLQKIVDEFNRSMGTKYKIDKKNELYIIQELIRESLINSTNEELPYESAVRIISYDKQKNIDQINAEIIVTKENHKKIIIGKDGKMIKSIGIKARKNIE